MRSVPLLWALGAVLLLANVERGVGRGASWPTGAALPDTAQEELDAGRFWHAARALRAEGAAQGPPERVLLLARAEAGWSNWPAVVTLLEGADWLDGQSDGAGWLLLGRGREDALRWATAASAYENFLRHTSAADPRHAPALARLARVSAQTGNVAAALAALDRIEVRDSYLRSWTGAEMAQAAAQAADTAAVRQLLQRVTDSEARSASWRALPEARLAAGDSSGAQRALRDVLDFLEGARRADASVESGRLALAHGDSALARALLLDGLEGASPANAGRAAGTLVDMGGNDIRTLLNLAQILETAGDGARALAAYDRAHADSDRTGVAFAEGPRLARARLMGTVRDRQDEALEEFRSIDATTLDPRIGARNLEVWAAMRRRQNRAGDVDTIERWLVERHPSSQQAAEVVWQRGIQAEFAGSIDEALEDYALVARNARTNQRAGQARMRTGQIHISRGRVADAAGVYEAYLADFPDGARWDEASFWAARTRLALGDTAAARRLVGRIRSEQPVSYYAVMGADLLGQPYALEFPEGDGPIEPEWLTEGLRRIDLLVEAGLETGAVSEQQRLIERSRGEKPVMLALAEALIARGRTISGINLGWDIRAEGHPWDLRLLRVVYPYPYRVLVEREAAEWGADPMVFAAMIRQESAFDARIVSRAGAVGLMQVMPPTGRELARTHGPTGFRDVNLMTAEVNLHLGAVFYRDMSRRYDGSLALVLSAYNAGPTRATRWRAFPEATDHARFADRVPIEETRGYLKNVRRNLGIYRALYPAQ